jgi:hypothetical protein
VNPFDVTQFPQALMRPPASSADWAKGHGESSHHRDAGGGVLGPPPCPVTGMYTETSINHDHSFRDSTVHTVPIPKLEFPKFDGENPCLWHDRCENYFEVYSVSDGLKTRFAALNFMGAAALWLQTKERMGRISDWEQMYKAVFDQFDRDQYQIQLRQLEGLKQTGSVQHWNINKNE